MGRASEVPWAGTSKTQPWVCSSSSPFSSREFSLSPFSTVVSSQLSQVPQGRRAAGAVPDRAAQARPRRFELGGSGIEDQVRAAPLAELVICRAGRAERDSRAIDFMIPAECDGVAVCRDHGHTIMRVRGRAPVGERVTGPAEGNIAEPFGKFEEFQASGVIPSRPQRAEAADALGLARAKVTGPLVE
jgi:hypothetical protein